MIFLTQQDTEKIEILDQLFGSLDVEQLRKIAESEIIVAKLKGEHYNPRVLRTLISEYTTMKNDLDSAKADLSVLRGDLQTVVKIMQKPFDYQARNDFDNLKNKFGIYS